MKIAASTNDGENLVRDHFGEGKFFLIYEVDARGYRFLEKRENTSPPEEEHGSKEKALGIASILRDVDALLGFQFGPNIVRIREKFLPVLSREPSIERALENIVRNYDALKDEMRRHSRNVVILDGEGIKVAGVKNGEGF